MGVSTGVTGMGNKCEHRCDMSDRDGGCGTVVSPGVRWARVRGDGQDLCRASSEASRTGSGQEGPAVA